MLTVRVGDKGTGEPDICRRKEERLDCLSRGGLSDMFGWIFICRVKPDPNLIYEECIHVYIIKLCF